MTVRLLTMAWLMLVWVMLWGDLTLGNVLGGLMVSAGLILAFPVSDRLPWPVHFRPWPFLRLLWTLAREVVVANVFVTWEVLRPGAKEVNEGIIAVPVTDSSPVVLSVLAGLVSLTPGTLIVELPRERNVFYIHVFHLHSVDEARLRVMRNERVVLRAIGSPECLQAVERRIAELERRVGQKGVV